MKSAILALAAALVASSAFAQAAPKLEVATVRLHSGPPRDGVPQIAGNRLTLSGLTLRQLITYAYDLKIYQYSGGPDWAQGPMDGNSYDVIAQAEGEEALTLPRARQLLQLVLADRFQLNVHRETKETPVYALVIARGGPKFKESDPEPKPPPRAVVTPTTITSTFTQQRMELLVRLLSSSADRPVLDRTGLTGLYDFKLEYARDPAAAAGDVTAPSIFTALQEQLGLKLEPQTAPIEITVVDSVERPTEN